MTFWDSSALLPLLLDEPHSANMRAAGAAEQDRITVWWATEAECASGLARAEREGRLTGGAADQTFQQLRMLAGAWSVVNPSREVMAVALRMVRLHPLRAADALQLAAALVAARGCPERLPFVTLDDRLAVAARKEGFPVLGLANARRR